MKQLRPLLIALGVAGIVVAFYYYTRIREGGRATVRESQSVVVATNESVADNKESYEPHEAPPTPLPVLDDELVSDELLDAVVENAARQPAPVAAETSATVEAWRLEVLQAEDNVFVEMPKYEEVKSQYLIEAQGLLAQIDAEDTEAVLALARKQIDAFWEGGALASRESYHNGFLAWAIMEIAVEKDPENFALLSELKEAMSTMMPLWSANREPRCHEAHRLLWPVIDKQKQLIDEGKVPPSGDTLVAMYDWARNVLREPGGRLAAVPAWEWLVDNAEEGGWEELEGSFRKALAVAKEGHGAGIGLFAYPVGGRKEYIADKARHGRRATVLMGSTARRKSATPRWQDRE